MPDTLNLQPGQTLQLEPRAYNLALSGGAIQFPPGCKVKGIRGKTSINCGVTQYGNTWDIHGDGVELYDLILNTGGIFSDKPGGGHNKGIKLDNVEFHLPNVGGVSNNGLTITSGWEDFAITNTLFTGGAGFAIFGDKGGYKNGVIANVEIIDQNAGIHWDSGGDANNPANGSLLVEQVYLKGIRGMGLEFQGAAQNLTFQDLWFEFPRLDKFVGNNLNSFCYSLILAASRNIRIRRLYANCPDRPDLGTVDPHGNIGVGERAIFEIGGDDCILEDCYSRGGGCVVADNDGEGTSSVTVRNNNFDDFKQGITQAFKIDGVRTMSQSTNGPGVKLSWDIARGRPQRNKRYGATTPPPVIIDPPPVIVPPPAKTIVVIGYDAAKVDVQLRGT